MPLPWSAQACLRRTGFAAAASRRTPAVTALTLPTAPAPHNPPVLRRLSFALALILAAVPLLADNPVQGGVIPINQPLFPANNWWNIDVTNAPTDVNADTYLTYIGKTKGLHPDFGGDAGDGNIYGFPFIIVDGNQAKKTVDFTPGWPDQSDGVDHDTETSFPFYPVPDEAIAQNAWVEGGQPGNVDQRDDEDRHILMVDKTNNHLYELYNVWYNGTNWEAASGAFFNMNTNNRRPDTWTSADAAGLAILPGLVRYDEVAADGPIRHAFRFTTRSSNGYVYPASHEAGSTTNAPPMGTRLRLKASKNISSYPANVQKIFQAMKTYGLILADNGTDMYISGAYDVRWDNDILNPAFDALKADDFEVIQLGWQPSVTLVLSFPSAVGANDATTATVTAYDSSYNIATGYTGTIHFTSTDGAATLPLDYTFTGGDAGVHTFTGGFTLRTSGSQVVYAKDNATPTITGSAGVVVGPQTPSGLVATGTASQIAVSWNPVTGATQYQLLRASALSGYTVVTTTASTSYPDAAVTAGNAYVYKVRALDSASRPSPYSTPDAAIVKTFTNDPLVAQSTVVKAIHVTELRDAVNALRAVAALGSTTFTNPTLTGQKIKKIHIDELRTALNTARTTLGISAVSFTDPTIAANGTRVKAAHVQELRSAVK